MVKTLSFLLTFVLLIVVALFAAMWVLAKGPSPNAQHLFVMTARETSAMYWLANVYLSAAEIESIMSTAEADEQDSATDISLISIPTPKPLRPEQALPGASSGDNGVATDGTAADDEQVPADDDGIEIVEIAKSGYIGYMMIVNDPKRVFVGTPSNFGGSGITLMQMTENTGAIAGINAGGFFDPDGRGGGGEPEGIVICDGVLRWGQDGTRYSTMGFDSNGILHVGMMNANEAMALDLQWAVSFGPTLIKNGVAQDVGRSGINPRTAIGQREDGAVLMLVVDGRQIHSLGATYADLIEIFLDFGAVNAANLDGGSSTLMVHDGEFVNTCAAIGGPRPIPTAFLVSSQGEVAT